MSKVKFYICEHCQNLVEMIYDSGVNPVCCGEKMKELVAGTSDGAREKHVPEVTVNGNEVSVVIGSVEHPMIEKHYIMWIYLETKKGGQRVDLKPGEAPKAKFLVIDDEPVAVYEYCNLHGLWKTEL